MCISVISVRHLSIALMKARLTIVLHLSTLCVVCREGSCKIDSEANIEQGIDQYFG